MAKWGTPGKHAKRPHNEQDIGVLGTHMWQVMGYLKGRCQIVDSLLYIEEELDVGVSDDGGYCTGRAVGDSANDELLNAHEWTKCSLRSIAVSAPQSAACVSPASPVLAGRLTHHVWQIIIGVTEN